MAKKNKAPKTTKAEAVEPPQEPISSLGWKIIAAGGVAVLLGFLTLSKADPLGRNWASDAAPVLILAGYAAIGLGLFVPASSEEGGAPSSPSSPSRP